MATYDLPPMTTPRCSFTAAVVDGYIYAIAGQNFGCLDTVERYIMRGKVASFCTSPLSTMNILFYRYDIKAKKWSQIAPLSMSRIYAAAVNFCGTIFVIGGQQNGNIRTSVEYYVPSLNKWVSVAPMNTARTSPQAGVANNSLYVCGGANLEEVLASIEKYNPETDSWTQVYWRFSIWSYRKPMFFYSLSK